MNKYLIADAHRSLKEEAVREATADLRQQRDELLEALREMTGLYDGMREDSFWSDSVRAKVYRARAVIAQATGAKGCGCPMFNGECGCV